jgi:hypothetical protein
VIPPWFKEQWDEERGLNAAFRTDVCERLDGLEDWVLAEKTRRDERIRIAKQVLAIVGMFATVAGAAVGLLQLVSR